MTTERLPVLGGAFTLDNLELYRDWILEKQRDVELQSFFPPDVFDGDWRPLVDRARTLLDGHAGRLGVHGPFWGFKLDCHDRLLREAVQTRLLQGLEACELLGATQMVIHSPTTTWEHNTFLTNPEEKKKQVERTHETLRPVVARAEAIGCALVIENIEDKDPFVRVELARSFDSPAVRVSLDVGHAHYARVSTGAPPLDVYVAAAGDMLAHLHLQDADGFSDRHWAPGRGTLNWKALFSALGRLGTGPRLIIEVKEQHIALREGADFLVGMGLAE